MSERSEPQGAFTNRAVIPRVEVGIDSVDPERLVPFWSAALGYVRGGGNGEPYIDLYHPDGRGHGPVVFLQRVPEPKAGKNRLHIDLFVTDADALVDRLVWLGATKIGEPSDWGGGWFQILADPEGNEFCVCREED